MLRMSLDVSWEERLRNVDPYAGLQEVTEKIREKRMPVAGHCVRHLELAASPLILWEPTQVKASRGRERTAYIGLRQRDTGVSSADNLRVCMESRRGRCEEEESEQPVQLEDQPRPDDDEKLTTFMGINSFCSERSQKVLIDRLKGFTRWMRLFLLIHSQVNIIFQTSD